MLKQIDKIAEFPLDSVEKQWLRELLTDIRGAKTCGLVIDTQLELLLHAVEFRCIEMLKRSKCALIDDE